MNGIMSNVSCLISCFHKDSPSQLREALQSLSDQTLLPTEIVLIEDGSLSPALYKIIDEFCKKLPIKRIKLPKNKGLGNALNRGLLECSNDIVVRMDTDDICHTRRFETQVRFLDQHKDISIVGTWAKDIDEKGNVIGERVFPTCHEDIFRIIWSCPFAHPTVAFRKKDILRIGSYSTEIKRRQDYDLWMRAASCGLKFANIPEYLLFYRFTADYYKKNNLFVAWSQAMMGVRGLRRLRVKSAYPYIAVFSPVFRSLLPNFIERPVHRLMRKVDPRSRFVK